MKAADSKLFVAIRSPNTASIAFAKKDEFAMDLRRIIIIVIITIIIISICRGLLPES